MITTKIVGKKVCIYDSIDSLPMERFHKYNKSLIVDCGVGADLNSIDNHIERAMRFIETNKVHALQELENLRQCIYLINQEVSPKNLAFATLVYSIDGKECNDISDEGLKKTLEILNKRTKKETDQIFDSVQKKNK